MRFLRLKEVMLLTGLGRSTIYKFMADETDFPKSASGGLGRKRNRGMDGIASEYARQPRIFLVTP